MCSELANKRYSEKPARTPNILSHQDWKQIGDPKFKLYAFQGQSEGEFNGGYAITPNYSVFSVASSTVTDDIDYIIEDNKKYADDGTLSRFKLDNKYYTWNYNENRYENKEGSSISVFELNPIDKSKLDDTKDIYLFFNKNNPCGKTTYKYISVKEYLKATNDLSSFIHDNNDNRKDLPCIGATSSTVDNGNNNWKFDPNNQSDDGSNEECNTTSFEYLSTPSDKDIQSIKTVFLKGFNDRKSIQTKEREQGKYSHIQYVNNSGKEGSIGDVDKDDLELLEDKLHLLSYYKKDTYVGVVFLKRNFKEFYKADLVDKLASEVIKSSAGELGGKKAMLIIVPYTYKVAHDTDCLPIGFSQTKDNDIVKYSAVKIDTKKKWLSKVLGIYTEIPKPLFVNRYYKMADGKIIQRAESSVKDIKGYPFINNLTFYESKGYDAIRSLNDEYKNTNFKEYLGLYAQYLEKANKLYFEYTTKEEQEGSINNANLWDTIATDDLGKFREIYMDDVKLTNKLWEKSVNKWAWGSKVEIALNIPKEDVQLLPKHFYNFNKMLLVDDVVYGVVDGIGLIPGVDTFTDPIGAVYAGIRGDYTNATIYSASFSVPLVGSAYVKGVLKAGEDASHLFGIVAKKSNNAEGYILEVKKISEISANEVHISSVYYGGDQKLTQKVLDGINLDGINNDKKFIDGDYVRKSLTELSGNFASFLSKIDNLPNLSVSERNALKADINSSVELKNLFVKNIDKTDELSDAWKNIGNYHTQLKKDPTSLNAFVALKNNPSFDKMGLTDDIIGSLQGYSTATRSASYAEVLADINNFGNFLKINSGTSLENFDKIVNIFKRTDQVGNNYKQGVHWMIRDLNTNGSLFAGKKIKFEHSIQNARPSNANSSIDILCIKCKEPNIDIMVEYKSGPGSISSSTIKEQFIERDLFNANSLDEIQWRMERTGMTKEKLKTWMKENKAAIDALPSSKKTMLFSGYDELNGITDLNINNFVDNNYSKIFK